MLLNLGKARRHLGIRIEEPALLLIRTVFALDPGEIFRQGFVAEVGDGIL